MSFEVRRKLIHAATGIAAPWVLYLPEPAATGGLVVALLGVLGLELGALALRPVRRRPGPRHAGGVPAV